MSHDAAIPLSDLQPGDTATVTQVLPLTKRIGFWGREYVARNLATWDAWFPPDTMLGPREPTPDDPSSPGPRRDTCPSH